MDTNLAVGVSGGRDSMVLLYVLKQLGYHVTATHVNFNLRGEDSMQDAAFVRSWCTKESIPYLELDIDTKTFAAQRQLNIQSAARDIRYQWWNEIKLQHKFDYVATAHHQDDSIETLFLHLLRGTGIKGLRGIPGQRDFYIRPMLSAHGADIEDFCQAFAVPFRLDASNLTDTYQRNKIRHHLLPLLEDLQPGFRSSIRQTIHRINEEWKTLDVLYHKWVDEHVVNVAGGNEIAAARHEISFMLRWLEEKGFPWKLSYDYLNAASPASGNTLQHEGMVLSRTANGFYFGELIAKTPFVISQPGTYVTGAYTFQIDRVPTNEDFKVHSVSTVFVNQKVIEWPLVIRPVEAGDSFQPFGMQGHTKKLQDLMVDLKMEPHEKRHQLLLCNPNHIIWVIGLRPDERTRVDENDDYMYRIVFF